MRVRVTATAAAAAAVALLAGCTGAPLTGRSADAELVTVAVGAPLTAVNPATSYGDTTTNQDVASLTRSGFGYYDDQYRLVRDESFGSARIVSRDPFTVRYTVAEGVRWSDGTPIDARDLLLSWAAESGALNDAGFDPSPYVDASSGRFTDAFPRDAVWFDGKDAALASTVGTPVIRSGNRALEVTYSAPFSAWPIALEPTLPARLVGSRALDAGSGSAAASAVAAAILDRSGGLPAVARFWNDAGNLDAMPAEDGVLAASGPYRVSAIRPGASVTLSVNPRYSGSRTPVFRSIRLVVVADPLEQAARLSSGAVDIATPPATADVVKALINVPGVRVSQGAQGVFERLDLKIGASLSGTFANVDVRRAFLLVVPRREIVQQLIQPVDPEAQPLRSFTLPPGSDAYAAAVKANGSREYAEVDVEGARRLLAQAGVADPPVCILYDPESPRRRQEFALIRASAARAGFRVTDCASRDWRSRLGVPGAYDAVLTSRDAGEIGTAAIGRVYASGNPLTNLTGYADPEVDALVARLDTASSARQREILAEIDRLLWRDAYGAPLFQYPAVSAVRRRIARVTLSPLEQGVFWNAWQWAPSGVRQPSPQPSGSRLP